MTLILNNEDVEKAIDFGECLQAMDEVYRELPAGRAANRPTSQIYMDHSLPEATYSFKSVEGAVKKFGILALRITSDIVREEKHDGSTQLEKLPLAGKGQYLGLVQLFSIENGELLILGLLGSGGQARSHLRFLTSVRPIQKVKVFSPNPDHRKTFAAEMEREIGIAVEAVISGERAIKDCDIVCSATNSSRPVMTGAWLEPGMHYNAIREFEIDESVFEQSDVIAIHTRYGGIQHNLPPGLKEDLPAIRREKPRDWSRYPEISDFLIGRATGRTTDQQITFFLNNVGTGVQFASMGYCVYRRAKQMGMGREIPTDWFLQDIKP